MRRQEIINRLRDQLALLVVQVRAASALDQTDIHRLCENVVAPLLSAAMDLPRLQNLNQAERRNFPGIDLGDAQRGVGIQVTSRADAAKLRSSIKALIDNHVYSKYPRLYVYVLEERQATYRIDLSEELAGLVVFDPSEDVLDYRDLLARLADRSTEELSTLVRVLDSELGRPPPAPPVLDEGEKEPLWLNLLRLEIPGHVFVTELLPEVRSARGATRRGVKNRLDALGIRVPTDWTVHDGQLISFHDLTDRSMGFGEVVDIGAVTPLESWEYFSIRESYLNAFKDLLRRCLQQKLYHRGVLWQHQERLFIFSDMEDDGDKRRESWTGEVAASRTVFERERRRDNEEETYYCKHLAFAVTFHHINDEWLISIKPEWFFSVDGYRKWYFGPDRVDWLKKREKNQHVFNHVKFITHFLSTDPDPSLFETFTPYPFLTVRGMIELHGGPKIDDEAWRAREGTSEQRRLLDPIGDLPLFGDANGTSRTP